MALDLGIAPDRINTTADFPAIARYGVKGEGGAAAASAATLAELAESIAAGDLVVPIQRAYPLDEVREAFTEGGGSCRREDRPCPVTASEFQEVEQAGVRRRA